jgi:hypothetical protein
VMLSWKSMFCKIRNVSLWNQTSVEFVGIDKSTVGGIFSKPHSLRLFVSWEQQQGNTFILVTIRNFVKNRRMDFIFSEKKNVRRSIPNKLTGDSGKFLLYALQSNYLSFIWMNEWWHSSFTWNRLHEMNDKIMRENIYRPGNHVWIFMSKVIL